MNIFVFIDLLNEREDFNHFVDTLQYFLIQLQRSGIKFVGLVPKLVQLFNLYWKTLGKFINGEGKRDQDICVGPSVEQMDFQFLKIVFAELPKDF